MQMFARKIWTLGDLDDPSQTAVDSNVTSKHQGSDVQP